MKLSMGIKVRDRPLATQRGRLPLAARQRLPTEACLRACGWCGPQGDSLLGAGSFYSYKITLPVGPLPKGETKAERAKKTAWATRLRKVRVGA